jgi:Ca2+-transporting ATPase
LEEGLLKPKTIRGLPGMFKVKVFGLKQLDLSNLFCECFLAVEGIQEIKLDLSTETAFISYNPQKISAGKIAAWVLKWEQIVRENGKDDFKKQLDQEALYKQELLLGYKEAAAATAAKGSIAEGTFLHGIPTDKRNRGSTKEKVPLSLSLAIGGLGVLGVKQLLWGKSDLARHPLPFYLSGAISCITGYSFLKRGVQQFSRNKKLNADMLVGAGSLALALVRENLVVLAGISLLQYVNWRRNEAHDGKWLDHGFVSPETEAYSRKASRLGFMGAAAAFAITRNPMTALAVLLAANPRPATVAAEYTWKQAQHAAIEAKLPLPANGSMYRLSQMNKVILEDRSLLVHDDGTLRPEAKHLLHNLTYGQIVLLDEGTGLNQEKLRDYLFQHYKVGITHYGNLKACSKDEILFITKDSSKVKEKVISIYPTIAFSQLKNMLSLWDHALKIKQLVHRNTGITKIWNIAGTIAAFPLLVSAPLINLMGDSITLAFLSNAKMMTEQWIMGSPKLKPNLDKKSDTIPERRLIWHAKTLKEICHDLGTDPNQGLDEKAVSQLTQRYGKNVLHGKQRPHWIISYLGQFKEFTTVILGATAVISLFTGHLFDGLVMSSILLINVGIGTFQERKAEKAIETMSHFVPPKSDVLRQGRLLEIDAADLVPGDIVHLEAGQRIPADLRLIQGWNLEVNESALTGESLPVFKKAGILKKGSPLSEHSNMLYMGTHVTRGKATAVVAQTGSLTEMGHLLSFMNENTDMATPLQHQVTSISKRFMRGALMIGIIVFGAGLLRGIPITQMATTSISLAASAIPEGLPMTITFALTAGIFRMAKNKALIRRLSALETLGRTTMICSDKTGTLTKNEMTVKKIATVEKEYHVEGNGYSPSGTLTDQDGKELYCDELYRIVQIGMLCSNTSLLQEGNTWNIKGDPTEGALVTLAAKRGLFDKDFSQWKKIHEIPFDSASGMMTVVCKEEGSESHCYSMAKGSVEKILDGSTHYQVNGKILKLNEKIRNQILRKNEEYAEQALRVLAFAYKPVKNENCTNGADQSLIFTGLAGMIDPPKDDVKESIREARQLGITPVMITGDHPKTAVAIAKEIGIYQTGKAVITGQELDLLSDDELEKRIEDIAVFARVTPEHKLKIVSLLQKKNHIVAMTGDGVNDSPAIKKADIGIAMGQTGTQVTKETADMILKEDHFAAIVEGVKEGRTIIDNIRKALGCLLSGNLAEIIVTSAAVIAGLPIPLVPIHILLMNLLTDALPAMVLAVNPGNKTKITKRQGIIDKELYLQVISRGLLLGTGALGIFALSLSAGHSLVIAQTAAFATLVSGQLIQTFSWRQQDSEEKVRDWTKDRFLLSALGVSWLSLMAVIYIPAVSGIFKTAPLPLTAWIPILFTVLSSAKLVQPILRIVSPDAAFDHNRRIHEQAAA